MRALEFTHPGTVALVDAAEPIAGPDEAIVSVEVAGICGSDLHGIHGGFLRKPPLIMGHEFSGTVEGRRVAVNPLLSCGHCPLCTSDRDQLCGERAIVGITRAGGLAERVAVPSAALVDIGPGLSFEAAAMVEPLAVALRGWRLAHAHPEQRVAIVGAGSIGLLVLGIAVLEGHTPTVVDSSPTRLRIAEQHGGGALIPELTGEFDVIIDAVGAAATHAASVEHLARQGSTIWIGNASADAAFDARELVRREQTVRGSFAYSRMDFRDAAGIAPRLAVDWNMVYPLARVLEVFDSLSGGAELPVKAQFRPAG